MSARRLTPVEENVLALGLNFAVVPRVLPKEEFVQRLEPKLYHMTNNEASNIRVQITEVLRRATLPASNLTKNKKDALKNLRADKSIHILKADKGNATVILDRLEHDNKILALLNTSTYKELKRDPTANIERKICSKLSGFKKADGDEAKIPQEQKNCTDQKPSSSQVPAELLKSAEETCNRTSTKKLPKEDLLCLEKCIEEFSASNVYTISASSKEPLNEKIRKSMTANVKSSAYKNLLSPNEDRHSGNDGKFVSDDQQILNFATEDVWKNTATGIPARLFKTLGKNMKSIGQISCGQIQGTCWLVADMLVITNCHVYMSFNKERRDHPDLNLPITVKFDYLHPGQGQQVEVNEERDPQLESFRFDYKVLRLKEDEGLRGREPLGPLVRSCPLQEGLVIIVGHPAGKEMHQETCVVVRNHSWRQKLQDRKDFKHSQMNNDENSTGVHLTNNDLLRSQSHKFQEQGCLPYDTSLFSGASGSPVFNLNGNIVAMHTQGYILNTGEEKWSLMEFGVQFNAICKDMKERYIEPNVVKKLFPDCDLENMDIDN
ncbi:Hypothetical predicted protein [Paramuricea clavata]|uniref:Uncharacterized protein n=1 Tax=Paramuricea clavata TaxID=317549 RepID=A0A7D9JMF9_PARCT|nr:Hypothetical predicted protein [Paramuricea clavata]